MKKVERGWAPLLSVAGLASVGLSAILVTTLLRIWPKRPDRDCGIFSSDAGRWVVIVSMSAGFAMFSIVMQLLLFKSNRARVMPIGEVNRVLQVLDSKHGVAVYKDYGSILQDRCQAFGKFWS
ncbi:hypothetical protein N018_20620 [Pseudomonas syringae CC1557]|uniref:Uncharacterized protein n=1 Tax=Pseudomonas syringae CC1557 TaxID=1357279 RepID=W0N2Z6_PSESX|nr:hypothetical protein N018_20620 [Pseudomonas syringae CC1557]